MSSTAIDGRKTGFTSERLLAVFVNSMGKLRAPAKALLEQPKKTGRNLFI
jgi:hypothetical protein